MSIKRFHEAPKSIFKDVQRLTDGDYALVNLFAEDEEYFKMFRTAVVRGREVILDNGVFELGTAWNSDEYATWIEKLQPTYYIMPDVLEDAKGTVESFFNFHDKYKSLPGKIIGVVQGSNLQEFIDCYRTLEPYCDKIGISFDCSWYVTYDESVNYWRRLAYGRLRVLELMDSMGIINRNKPHHLLGVALPQELREYAILQRDNKFGWLDSVDTSNPVVHGLKGIAYTKAGLQSKETEKLFTLVNSEVSEMQMLFIEHNIEIFRRFCHA